MRFDDTSNFELNEEFGNNSHKLENQILKIESNIGQDERTRKKKEALSKLDNAKFGCFHVRACVVSGIGFFTDAYDLFIINLVMLMMGCVYYKNATGQDMNKVPVYIDTLIKASGQVGTLIGQILFGILADRLGRKRMYGVELMIIVVSTCASALSASTVSGFSVFTVLGIWRIFLGLGIGGDYPLSAIITSEFATTKRRGAMMAAVFAMQGFGILVAALVAIILLSIFKSAVIADQNNLDYVWRLCIGLGAIPGCVAIYFRLTIPETPRYTIDIDNNVSKAANDVDKVTEGVQNPSNIQEDCNNENNLSNKASFSEFCSHFSKWKNFKVLMGTSVTWFALDVAFYGINLNSGIIISAIGFSGTVNSNSTVVVWNYLFNNSVGNIIIALMGTVPGYWVSVLLIDRWGRKTIQIIGFIALTCLFIILGFGYDPIKSKSIELFIFLFTLSQFFQNFGPNTTTFIIPGEVFPTRYRSTAHGISAAMGKLGAIISQVGFFQLKDLNGIPNSGIPLIIQIFSGFMLIGLVFTYFVPETKGKTLEQLSGEEPDSDESNTDENNFITRGKFLIRKLFQST